MMKIKTKLLYLYINLFPNAIVHPDYIEFEHLVDLIITELLKRNNQEYLAERIIDNEGK